MDPNTRLDHALFQLTPTRTRCDLIIAGGGVNERLASGLLEPFLCHLKSAKDQICKGGYSITLHPASAHAQWFTKVTLQRFVRFVSTPEVLERFVTIEKEIVQIESSIQSSEKSKLEAEGEDGRVKRSTTSSKLRDELGGTNQDGYEENSRVRLQRVLDNRKSMLCKEQAMAYARALVAGFHPESVDDLIYFADAFGASRLREACINFLDLCKQKNEDKLWMDEIAAMQASAQPVLPYLRTSGIILAGEDDNNSKLNGIVDASISDSTASLGSLDISQDNSFPISVQTTSTDGRAQIPMPWPNHLPQYMHNFQGPAFQQMPPYQGYLYPGMQVPSSYYPGNMQWPPNVEDSHNFLDRDSDYHKSSLKKKKKKKHRQVLEHSEEDASTESIDSSYETNSDDHSRQGKKHSSSQHKKKHKKKSSRKVVIRNINYITSNRDGEKGSVTEGSLSNEEEFIDGDSLERKDKLTSGHHKTQYSAKHADKLNGSTDVDSNAIKGNDNWDAFQNLLLRDDEQPLDAEKEHIKFQEEYNVNKNFEGGRSNEFNHRQDITKTRATSNDSFVVTERELGSEGHNHIEYFNEWKQTPSSMKKKDSTCELFSQRNEESGSGGYSVSTLSGCGPESSLAKSQKEEDWFIVNHSSKPANEDQGKNFSIFDGVSILPSATNGVHVEENKKNILADDSFMIQARSSENQYNSQTAAGIRSVSDIVGVNEFANITQEGSHNKTNTLNSHEPDDLYMVLGRDSSLEQNAAPWSVEMDFESNISLNEANRKLCDVETDKKQQPNGQEADTKTPGVRNGKVSSKEVKSKALNASLVKNKSDISSRSKASPGNRSTHMKSKSEKEEESRKRREELLAQRQKRIAERSASKKTEKETKNSLNSAKKEKTKIYPSNEETKELHKPVLRKSTIERLATSRVTQKVSPSQAKSGPTKKPSLQANGVSLQKTGGTVKKKQVRKEAKSSNKKEDSKKTNVEILHDTNAKAQNEMKGSVVLPVNSGDVESVETNKDSFGLKNNGELSKTLPEKHARDFISEGGHVGQIRVDSSLPNRDHTFGRSHSRGEEVLDKLSLLPGDNKPRHITDVITNPMVSPSKPPTVFAVNSKVNHEIEESNDVSTIVSEKKSYLSTPQPSDQMMPEPVYSRKKWNSDEDSSKAAKGFRKLLFFGRKS
ncbi:hypothetical protein TanjilG_26890 [Lupinus angustifolius]|uniref:COP1-interacting protein 7 n=1 Tax=Lupinus angustifolius TaxID=3871 RepID=A0A4P1RIN7_LUPAN|nr:PREDICTED: uncharacterized protein LOC109348161 [Lupinus angustifolius]XP_019443965.1 PREDICTED: uncharacterized protein LOC109348161 [Lupinus angustifolius]OIW11524.1 hypothetical protein TanjilG_26890 [Lupinus angustifolius]